MTEIKAKVVEFDLLPHPNADTLSVALIRDTGWQCIVKTSDMQDKTLGVYIPIDAEVPVSHLWFKFLDKGKGKPFRIKTIRLRGQLSQGLLIPAPENAKLGDDLTEELGITRWEPVIPAHMAGDMIREPGSFQKYTSIENYKNYPNVFKEGDQCRITEKLHGCLAWNTRINLVSGDKKIIRNIVPGDEIWGLDKNENLVSTFVKNTFNNGETNDWLNISVKRTKSGSGSNLNTIKCTPNHQFWIPSLNSYKEAKDLKIGDYVLSRRFRIEHTPVQEQVLLGTLLGDGCLRVLKNSAYIEYSHTKKDEEYFKLKNRALGDLFNKESESFISGYGSEMLRARSISTLSVKEKFGSFLVDGVKHIPEWVATELTPLAIAFWYMDDGSLTSDPGQEDRANFAVCNFNENDCQILIKGLKKFNINSVFYISHNKNNEKPHSRLRLNADEAEKLFLLIAPYIPPCMQRKLPSRYRGHAGWLPDGGTYKKFLIEQEIVDISKYVPNRPHEFVKYDLETETHNFFANGILVHNSNVRLGFANDGLIGGLTYMVGSHKTTRDKHGTNLYSKMSQKLQIEEKLKPLLEKFDPKENLIIYGEIYGWGVQDLRYGCSVDEQQFRIFDVLIDGHWQEWSVIVEISTVLGVGIVPLIYQGSFSIDKALSLRDGVTMLGEHIREGIVVTSEPEEYNPEVGRKIIKFISDDYLLRKNATDGH